MEHESGAPAPAARLTAKQLQQRVQDVTADRNQLLAIFASMREGVIAVDQQERILHINEAAADLLGIAAADSIGLSLAGVTRLRPFYEAMLKTLQSSTPVTMEAPFGLHGRELTIEITTRPLHVGGGAQFGAMAVLYDVSELRRLEAVRRDFLANVSHELKTPLTAIHGLVETLIDEPDMDRATQGRFLLKVQSQTVRLTNLITDILALSRLESQPDSLRQELIDLRDPVAESVQALAPMADAREVSVNIQVPDTPVPVAGDREALRQVVDNLLDNAIKYTPAGGRVDLRLVLDAPDAQLDVEDTGIGIEPHFQSRIFERFYRVDRARSRELGGTGLGLSIVRHTVMAMGGQVAVQSMRGRGSVFQVRLPLAPPAGSPPKA